MSRVIFHVDVNSAFLSWSAAYRVRVLGEQEDLRDIPSAVAGERAERHGIILAKSIPAKKCGVKTGEQIFLAQQKCPGLKLVPPDYALYVEASRRFIALLREFAPVVEQYSIDEAWADLSGTEGLYGSPVAAAELLRTRIREELGFTVNIGISSNKLLAKMAGEFESRTRSTRCSRRRFRRSSGRCRCGSCSCSDLPRSAGSTASASTRSASWRRLIRSCCCTI
ncbi:MAG: hypothetical protein ACLTCV_10170 [Oscillospiraceae bacterium]